MRATESPWNPPGPVLGLRVADIRSLAAALERLATALGAELVRLDGGVAGCAWAGPDAAAFRERWARVHRPALNQAVTELRQHAEKLLGEAVEQERTSEATPEAPSRAEATAGISTGFVSGAWSPEGRTGETPDWPGSGVFPQPLHAAQNIAVAGRQAAADQAYLAGMLGRALRGEPVPASALAAATILAAQSLKDLKTVLTSAGVAEPALPGVPVLGKPVPVATNRTGVPAARTPGSISDILKLTTDTYALTGLPGSTQGAIRITRVSVADRDARYIVSIPGTQQWSAVGEPSAFDLRGNLVTASGQRSILSQAVIDAIAATVPPGSDLLLAGHSQGGMTAMNLAADPAALAGYNLTHVVTYGSPVDNDRPSPGVAVLAFEHGNDIVPKTDLEGLNSAGFRSPLPSNLRKIDLAGPQDIGPLDVAGNHDPVGYAASVQAVENFSSTTELFGLPSLAGYLGGNPARTSAIDIPVSSRTRH